ncbi:MAG: hydrogenase expression/formation protein HypE [Coriobacteriales bacterium]|nr:hydrogenase expression/formation protein HypE [Coriobacteriales bacterium]
MQDKITLSHGSGGQMMQNIINDIFFDIYGNSILKSGSDAANLNIDSKKIAMSTDSFVINPYFFAGADIGHLAVCGTVNDVATSGAIPKFLSLSFILEEGLPIEDLKQICRSIAKCAKEAGVEIVTGDTKVVNKGACDGLFINTCGVGIFEDPNIDFSPKNCKAQDSVIISGSLADHGISIMSTREGLHFETKINSDAAPLNGLIKSVCDACDVQKIRAFRDPTRGGLASTLNEFANVCKCDIEIEEELVPVKEQVRGVCEMLGLDVFQVANEGKMVCVCDPSIANDVVSAMRQNEYGKDACIIGRLCEANNISSPKVYVKTAFGTKRIMDMLVGEQLPRIC